MEISSSQETNQNFQIISDTGHFYNVTVYSCEEIAGTFFLRSCLSVNFCIDSSIHLIVSCIYSGKYPICHLDDDHKKKAKNDKIFKMINATGLSQYVMTSSCGHVTGIFLEKRSKQTDSGRWILVPWFILYYHDPMHIKMRCLITNGNQH